MKRYWCLKYKNELCPAYLQKTKAEVIDEIYNGFGVTWSEIQRKNKNYSIVRVEIREIEK